MPHFVVWGSVCIYGAPVSLRGILLDSRPFFFWPVNFCLPTSRCRVARLCGVQAPVLANVRGSHAPFCSATSFPVAAGRPAEPTHSPALESSIKVSFHCSHTLSYSMIRARVNQVRSPSAELKDCRYTHSYRRDASRPDLVNADTTDLELVGFAYFFRLLQPFSRMATTSHRRLPRSRYTPVCRKGTKNDQCRLLRRLLGSFVSQHSSQDLARRTVVCPKAEERRN